MANFILSQPVLFVLHQLEQAGFEGFVVGGAVRDVLIGRPTTDWDFATNATPEQIMSVFKHTFYNNVYGTVGLPIEMVPHEADFLNGKTGNDRVFDITTYRFDGTYTDNRRPDGVNWGETLADDLSRRDFTVNAMALDKDGSIIDPYEGQSDIALGQIKAVKNPEERFREDALRMMRAIRFGAQLGFSIEAETLAAIKTCADLIKNISWERIRDELLKIIASDHPAEGIQLLYNSGLLVYILPETLAMRGIKQGGHHIYDVWTHSLEALRGCPSSDPLVRLAAFLHDIAKPQTVRYQGPRGVTFYGHEVVGARMVKQMAERLRLPNDDVTRLETLVRWHMFVYDKHMTDGSIRRFIRNVGLENINDMMLLRVGDRKGGGSKATSWRLNELQERIGALLYEPLSLKDLKISGADVMETLGVPPGRIIGDILNTLFEEVIDDSAKNEREYLLRRVKELGMTG